MYCVDIANVLAGRFLLEVGISCSSSGFFCLSTAIAIGVCRSELLNLRGSRTIFSYCAFFMEANEKNIRRSAKYSIDKAFKRGNIQLLTELFGKNSIPDELQFVKVAAAHLRSKYPRQLESP